MGLQPVDVLLESVLWSRGGMPLARLRSLLLQRLLLRLGIRVRRLPTWRKTIPQTRFEGSDLSAPGPVSSRLRSRRGCAAAYGR